MEIYFYHIKRPPLNVTIFITHVRLLCNGSYANDISAISAKRHPLIDLLWLTFSLEIYHKILIDSFSYYISPIRKNKTPLREMESFSHFRVTSQRAVSMRFLRVQNYV